MSEITDAPIPRFRVVLELSFPGADPLDPSGYQDLLAKWKKLLEENQEIPCQNVHLREALTIGNVDDYDDWRFSRGDYDASTWDQEDVGRKEPKTNH